MERKMFCRNENLGMRQRDCKKIWKYLWEEGLPNFSFNDVERLWEEFSDEVDASWLRVDGFWLDKFLDWLEYDVPATRVAHDCEY